MDELTQIIAERLKAAREKQGWNQSQLALKLGITASSTNQYEAGTKKPSTEILLKIAGELGVSTDYLLGASDDEKIFLGKEVATLFKEYKALSPRDRRVVMEVVKALKLVSEKDV